MRALLVEGRSVGDTAEQFGLSRPHVTVLKSRFLKHANNTLKVSVSEFKRTVAPDWKTLLTRFRPHILELKVSGYSPLQIADYLAANEINVPFNELVSFIGSLE